MKDANKHANKISLLSRSLLGKNTKLQRGVLLGTTSSNSNL